MCVYHPYFIGTYVIWYFYFAGMEKSRKNMLQFVIPNVGLILCFNSIPTVVMCMQYFKGKEITFSLPYLIWYPMDVYVMPLYAFIYAFQMWAGFVAVFGKVPNASK